MNEDNYMHGNGHVRARKGKRNNLTFWDRQAREADLEVRAGLAEWQAKVSGQRAQRTKSEYRGRQAVHEAIQAGYPAPVVQEALEIGGIDAVRQVRHYKSDEVTALHERVPQHATKIITDTNGNGKKETVERIPIAYLRDAMRVGGVAGVETYLGTCPERLKMIYNMADGHAPRIILGSSPEEIVLGGIRSFMDRQHDIIRRQNGQGGKN